MTTPSVLPIEARSYELDAYGHVNNAVYVSWLEHGRLCFLRDRGETYTSVPEKFGVHVVVVHQSISYRAQVQLGDRLEVVSHISRFGNTSFTFEQEVRYQDGGAIACAGEVVMVCVGGEGRPIPMPAELKELLDR